MQRQLEAPDQITDGRLNCDIATVRPVIPVNCSGKIWANQQLAAGLFGEQGDHI